MEAIFRMRFGERPVIPQHQDEGVLHQAAPVQNTWYTAFTGSNVKLIIIMIRVQTTGETLEVRFTVDGQVLTGTIAAVANTWYYVFVGGVEDALEISTTAKNVAMNESLEARTVKFEIRKTTAAGAGMIDVVVTHGKYA